MTNIIDPNGRILSSLPPFVEGYLIGMVPVHTSTATLYTRFGDWLPPVLLVLSLSGLAAGIPRRFKRQSEKHRA
jgi:apolipoprotein N-acyltransferase